jgi:hypothetical protein
MPPRNIRAEHAALRSAVLEYATELTPLIGAAEKGAIISVNTIVKLKGIKDMTKASLAMKQKGYDIIGPHG